VAEARIRKVGQAESVWPIILLFVELGRKIQDEIIGTIAQRPFSLRFYSSAGSFLYDNKRNNIQD
jgi:hypothetical protein